MPVEAEQFPHSELRCLQGGAVSATWDLWEIHL